MITNVGLTAIALKWCVPLFTKEYIKGMVEKPFVVSVSELNQNGANQVFLGFQMDDDKWTEYAFLEVKGESRTARYLDYRLPNGTRMATPIIPVHNS